MPAAERKRPFYLVLALLGALAYGTSGAFGGWGAFLHYHDAIDTTAVGQDIKNEDDRVAVVARSHAYLDAMDAAKPRGWPLGVASLLLGSAMFIFAMRALGGSGSARAILVQLVIVQAGVNAASFWLLHDVFDAALAVREAEQAAELREHVPDAEGRARAEISMVQRIFPFYVGAQAFGSALIVLALTRRRALAFFDGAGKAIGEQ
jgi:hypothetical protein